MTELKAPEGSIACHVCGGQRLRIFEGFADIVRVTSDCRPWNAGGALAVCPDCGVVQKRIDAAWQVEAAEIYRGYALYHQSRSRAEQHSFDPNSGFGVPRSLRVLEQVRDHVAFNRPGRMLDLGCGIGVTFRAFHEIAPAWRLEGYDPNLIDPEAVCALPGVVAVHGGSLSDLAAGFDCITCFHVLEHVVDPLALLRAARDLLTPDGALVVQVPYFFDNPFDLAIADHCSHFTPATITALYAKAGLGIELCSTSIIKREMTVVARRSDAIRGETDISDVGDRIAQAGIAWLMAMSDIANSAASDAIGEGQPLGVFGTSIAATFAANVLGDRIAFFVDEDRSRVGGIHLDRPIYAPDDAPDGAHLLIALTPAVADAVSQRLGGGRWPLHQPPKWLA